jgi:Domain of Unknown Function (DUF1206)
MTHTSSMGVGDRIERAGGEADRSDWMDHAIRFGLVAYGVVYLMIAWVAGQLALGKHSGRPSPQGALQKLAQQPLGHVLIWAIAVGLFVLVIWRALEAIAGHRGADGGELVRKRLVSFGKAVLYGALGVSAVRTALGGGQSSSRATRTMTAKVMDWPAGQWIVGAVGVAIIGYGLWMIWTGCTDRFLKHLDASGRSGEAGRAYTWFGRVGYTAKGVAFGIVGVLLGYAALTHEPRKSGGLDQGLEKVLHQPFGPWLLLAIAVGIGCYGLFCFAWARHLSR